MNILGVSALYHDSAACLVTDGEIVAAAQEERFTRVKHDKRLPWNAIAYCLREGGVGTGDLDRVAFYDKPLTKFTRLLSTLQEVAPAGVEPFRWGVSSWLKEKATVPYRIERFLVELGIGRPANFLFAEHHLSHAASAFYPSPFEEAAVLTLDGVGEWTTTALAVGEGSGLELLREQRFPHSLGLLYSAFTYFCGFRVNSGEYKLMGLAPYGEPRYADRIKETLIDLKPDGSFRLDLDYFGFLGGTRMTNRKFAELFDGARREPESEITQREADLARSIQVVTEEALFNSARYARAVTGKHHLCMAGGVALNCVATGKLKRSAVFDDLWVQPAAGDAGGALGAALYVWHQVEGNGRSADGENDRMRGAFLGPSFPLDQTRHFLEQNGLPFEELESDALARTVAEEIAGERVVGMFEGRMEFGPRALGHRSIVADARSPRMQSHLNLATKFREGFRPFAPIVLAEDAELYFESIHDSPYMLFVDQVVETRRKEAPAPAGFAWRERLHTERSDIPAVTHVDYSARLQTIDRGRHPLMHAVLSALKERTGYGIAVNTSFNVRGEPIVCTPEDAYRCFMRTGIDVLVLDRFVLRKTEQPPWQESGDWRESYELD